MLSITHKIYKFSDNRLEISSVFLVISKAFDKVWDEGVIFKLKQSAISGDLVNLLRNFLSSRKQRVILNDQRLIGLVSVNTGVPQGSILGPL